MRGTWRRGAVVLLLASSCSLLLAAQVRADEQYAVGPTPVLNVHLGRGKLTVQTWDRPQVQISSDGTVDVRHLEPGQVDPRIPRQIQIASQSVKSPHGLVTLPSESFVLPKLPGAEHDAIEARGNGDTTIMIPKTTAMVIAHVRSGHLNLDGYHGIFVAHVHAGGVSLNHVGGTGFIEALRGRVLATDSTFDRLRARTATGNMIFHGCTSRQIQASSAYGSIVYDDGSFQPGLARFDSEHGDVALGVRGGAQVGAYSGSGHVVSSFQSDARVQGDVVTKQATIGGGGPVVTATSRNGSVYLYSGSIDAHPSLRRELDGAVQLPASTLRPPSTAVWPKAQAPAYAAPVHMPESFQTAHPQQLHLQQSHLQPPHNAEPRSAAPPHAAPPPRQHPPF